MPERIGGALCVVASGNGTLCVVASGNGALCVVASGNGTLCVVASASGVDSHDHTVLPANAADLRASERGCTSRVDPGPGPVPAAKL